MFKTYSPIDNSVYVERHFATEIDIQKALINAQNAERLWRTTPLAERETYCTRAIDALVANKAIISEEICWQMGRPIRYAAGEVNGCEERARYMIANAEAALAPIRLPEKAGFIRYIKHEPLGICLIIAPWNYPYLTAVNTLWLAMSCYLNIQPKRHWLRNVLQKHLQKLICLKVFFNTFI